MQISQALIDLLQYLLPGFVAAAIFYEFTPYPKPAPFERVIGALVFTFFVTAIGDAASQIPAFSESAKTPLASLIIAILAGGIAAGCANYDIPHCWLRNLRLTDQMGGPSEWSFVFSDMAKRDAYIILNLEDGKRIYGWPRIWPDSPNNGHFLLVDYNWLANPPESGEGEKNDEESQSSPNATIFIDAQAVNMVEFLPLQEATKNEKNDAS